jgi:hypothetical protein
MAWDNTMPLDFQDGQGVDEGDLDPIVKNLNSLRNAAVLVGGFVRTTTAGPTSGATELVGITTPTLSLEANSTYKVELWGQHHVDTAASAFTWQMRQDNISGAVLGAQAHWRADDTGFGYVAWVVAYVVTTVAVSRAFVGTLVRVVGTGTATIRANTSLTVWRVGSDSVLTFG